MRLLAAGLLVIAFVLFIASELMPETYAVRMLRAGAEAALVGGLADWFAVVALFRKPMGLPIPHTAIIPKNKNRIADNLGDFVQEKFLSPDALGKLIAESGPADSFAEWIGTPQNARRIGRYAANAVDAWLDFVDEKQIQGLFRDAYASLVSKLDLSQSAASILETLTSGGRHQELLDAALGLVKMKLDDDALRKAIAEQVADWLRQEHKWKEKMLPTEWISDQAALAAANGIARFLAEVSASPSHELRASFDSALKALIVKLRTDEAFQRKGEALKEFLLTSPEAQTYVSSLWRSLRDWLSRDLESTSPAMSAQVEKMGLWIGRKLKEDDTLVASINEHIVKYASAAAPHFAAFLTKHIRQTIYRWNEAEMSQQIELSIGPDLQYIRLSGTAVGALIGTLLFLVSDLLGHLRIFGTH